MGDEEFNAEDAESESDDNSEDLIADDAENDDLSSELLDIDIVHDDKIYTEDAPRWLISRDDDIEFDVMQHYEQWEQDKLENGDNEQNADGFFESILEKYGTKRAVDPEEDKINKNDKYNLNDQFIDDGDCFDDHRVQTVIGGFFIARGHVDVIRSRPNSPKRSKKKQKIATTTSTADIPEKFLKTIRKIEETVKAHQDVMSHVVNDRFMHGIVSNEQKYKKHWIKEEETKENDATMTHSKQTIDTYKALLNILLEFDTHLLRENPPLSNKIKKAIYRQLSEIFEYDIHESLTKQQNNFEELLNWFSFDWFDDLNEDRKSQKMKWRILYLEMIKKRAKARFHGRMKKNQSKEKNEAFIIPWDAIIDVIFLLTCYGMEIAAINDYDMDASKNRDFESFRCSINKNLEKEATAVQIIDIEERFDAHKKKPFEFAKHCYSYLVSQRIKEQLKTPKKRKKKIANKSKKKSVAPIDLTMQITPKQSSSSTPNRNGLRLPSLETNQLQMNEDEMNGYDQQPLLACNEKHPSTTNSAQSLSSNNDNDVIDLTQTEVHSSNNSLDS